MEVTHESFVYINGKVVPSHDAKISIWDRGLVYGDGFFTTMRAEKGKIFFLKEHMERLKRSCKLFKIDFPEVLEKEDIFKKIMQLNGLDKDCTMIKVIITRGQKEGLGLPYGDNPTWIIIAKPYEPPYEKYKKGWHLIPFNIPSSTPISAHKSLNYLYNMWAREYAMESGADEAILIGVDGFVKETSVGTILFEEQGRWSTPEGDDILPGITLRILERIWNEMGISIKRKKITLRDLIKADQVWVLNSLIGIIPVSKIDTHVFKSKDNWDFADKCRKLLWEYALRGS